MSKMLLDIGDLSANALIELAMFSFARSISLPRLIDYGEEVQRLIKEYTGDKVSFNYTTGARQAFEENNKGLIKIKKICGVEYATLLYGKSTDELRKKYRSILPTRWIPAFQDAAISVFGLIDGRIDNKKHIEGG